MLWKTRVRQLKYKCISKCFNGGITESWWGRGILHFLNVNLASWQRVVPALPNLHHFRLSRVNTASSPTFYQLNCMNLAKAMKLNRSCKTFEHVYMFLLNTWESSVCSHRVFSFLRFSRHIPQFCSCNTGSGS